MNVFVLGASATLLVGVLAMPVMASASAETCRGLPATITGASGNLVGTEGADVIIARGGASVQALGGDDVICLRSSGQGVDAGSGNDVVDATAARAFTSVRLGPGSDTFVGGHADDQVYGAGNGSMAGGVFEEGDIEPDTITTGPGNDLVSSGDVDSVNDDRIATGSGDDRVSLSSSLTADGRLDVGSGANSVGITLAAAGAWSVDVHERTITHDGNVTTWSGSIAQYALALMPDSSLSTLSFDGSLADESLSVFGALKANLHMRGGDDSIGIYEKLAVGSVLSLGPGRDALSLGSYDVDGGQFLLPYLSVNLDDHRVDYHAPGASPDATVHGVETLLASAIRTRAAGTEKGDRISAGGCVVTVDGGQGGDRLARVGIGYRKCATVRTRLVGGPGEDRLIGANQTDDSLIGRQGTDTCRAEVKRDCE
jgi:hypothetical protein